MSKLIATAVVAVVLGFGVYSTAQAATQGSPCHPATASSAPVTSQAGANAYRSYSYEPSGPVTRSYRSYESYRSYSNKPTYLQGGSKALGRY